MTGSEQRVTLRTGRRAFAAAALVVMLWGGTVATAADGAKPIRLTIDYGDGVQKVFTGIEHREKLTVLGALETASKHSRGIKFTHQGAEGFAFVSAIDGLENEGRAAKNWTYSVNDKKADRSCGAWELSPGDSIVWRFSE